MLKHINLTRNYTVTVIEISFGMIIQHAYAQSFRTDTFK